MTEWHARYRGPGVMIYWHVEKRSVCIYSQLKTLLVLGGRRHDRRPAAPLHRRRDRPQLRRHPRRSPTSGSPSPTCSASPLLPRLKNIGAQRLYRPDAGRLTATPSLGPVLTRPIHWDLIAQQYDQMVKYATALAPGHRRGRADPAPLHPARPAAPHLRRADGAGPGREDHLRRRRTCAWTGAAPRRSTTASRSWRTGTAPTRSSVLRQGQRADRRRPRRPRGHHAGPPPAPVGPGAHQHHLAPAGPRRARVGSPAHRRGPPAPHPAVLDPRQPLRHRSQLHLDRHLDLEPYPRAQRPGPISPASSRSEGSADRRRRRSARPASSPSTSRAERPDYAYLKAVFRHLRAELDVEVQREAKTPALRAQRGRNPPLLQHRLAGPPRRGHGADQDAALHRRPRRRTRRHPPRRRRPRRLPDPHHPGKGGKDRVVPFPQLLPGNARPAHGRPCASRGAPTCSSRPGRSPTPPAASGRCSPATPTRAGLAHKMPPHRLRHFLFTWLKTQGIDDALIQPYSGHASRQSLEMYSQDSPSPTPRPATTRSIGRFPV